MFLSQAVVLPTGFPSLKRTWVVGHLPDRAKSSKSPGGFTTIETTVVLETLKALEIVLYPHPDLCLWTMSLQRSFLVLHGLGFLSWHAGCVSHGTLYKHTGVCISIQFYKQHGRSGHNTVWTSPHTTTLCFATIKSLFLICNKHANISKNKFSFCRYGFLSVE